jgi:hypothetical protein
MHQDMTLGSLAASTYDCCAEQPGETPFCVGMPRICNATAADLRQLLPCCTVHHACKDICCDNMQCMTAVAPRLASLRDLTRSAQALGLPDTAPHLARSAAAGSLLVLLVVHI